MKNCITCVVILFGMQSGIAQITGKIIDSQTGDAVSFANISINKTESRISNEEGYFTISEGNSGDDSVITISFLGYAGRQLSVAHLKAQQFAIRLDPVALQLDEVTVSGPPDAKTIMAEVKKNLKRNYAYDSPPVKDLLFLREANQFRPKKLDVEITKSTGFSKNALKSANAEINGFTSALIARPPREFTDMLCNYYSAPKMKGNSPKLDVVKATKLKDETRSASLEDLQKNATDLVLKHLDTTKYYRVKSGWFGSQDTISLRKDFNKKKNKKVNNQLQNSKTRVQSLLTESNLFYNTKLDFVTQLDNYEYRYEGSAYMNDQEFAYVISFRPDSRKAKYTGKLYISQNDFAVVRADYALADGKKLEGFNLKLLLGVKFSENMSTGTLIYKPDSDSEGYRLQYASQESGQYIYVNRPVKFIELIKGEKDVFAFDIKVEGNIVEKTELLDMSRNEISEADFTSAKEPDFTYLRIKQYDPKIWKDYGSIEPLSEMKRYTVAEGVQ